MAYGFFFISDYGDVIAMGVLLGMAGASFGVALSLGSGWFPREYKGLAMGIAGAGNSGTVLATLFGPPLATAYGWQSVYGFAGVAMLLPWLVMVFAAKEPPDADPGHSIVDHIRCLWEKDGWVFNLVYIVTFGGFIGLSNFLPTFFYNQFSVTKVEAGQLTTLAALVGSGMRILGGYFSDRIGGVLVLSIVLLVAIAALLAVGTTPGVAVTTLLMMLCFAALGAGNGAVFQLVPLRWPANTAVVGSMIGEVGALGGAIVPNAMGLSQQWTGGFAAGFAFFAVLALVVFGVLRAVQRNWVGRWIGSNGRAVETGADEPAVTPSTVYGA
jgi:NNP family nitrate/nitrite transporter-like MFS transporter